MSAGYQAVQSAHSLLDFAIKHPEISSLWHDKSNTLVCLQTEDENSLEDISELLTELEIDHIKFYEPDIGNELTSIALMSDRKIRKLFSKFPLLLKERKEVEHVN